MSQQTKYMKASYSLEFVCLFSVEMPTLEGDAYVFLAVDVFSEFVFSTGVEKDRKKDNLLKHVKLLVNNEDFKKKLPVPFTLVFHKYEELRKDIDKIIKPLGGKMIVDDLFVTRVLTPVIEHLFKSLSKK